MAENKRQIIYIAGAGRSGSTLLDVILGNHPESFSIGELLFFPQNGIIQNEYCSCGSKVKSCDVWSEVIKKWATVRELDLNEFINYQNELLRNKNFLKNTFNNYRNKSDYKKYINDLNSLYDIVFEVTNSNILIDSSKNVHYINYLKELEYDLKIIHIKRSYLGVLESTKKSIEKDSKLGVEKELKKQPMIYSFSIWMFENLFVGINSKGLKLIKIYYEDLISHPLNQVCRVYKDIPEGYKNKLVKRYPFFADHLVAGNKMRMQDQIFINPPSDKTSVKPSKLSKLNYFTAMLIDKLLY